MNKGDTIPPPKRFPAARYVLGNVIFLVAAFGLLLCLGGVAGAWALKNRVDAGGDAVCSIADESLVFVQGKLELVKQGLERNRNSAGDLSRLAARLKNGAADIRQECEPLLQSLDMARQNLQIAGSWLDSAEVLAGNVSRAAAIVSSNAATSQQESAMVDVAREVESAAQSLTGVLSRLQSTRETLIQFRDSGVLAREAALTLIDSAAVLDQALNQMDSRLAIAGAKTAAARSRCVEQGRRFRRWTLVATLVASILPLWLGCSQIMVMTHGWRMAHPSRTSALRESLHHRSGGDHDVG